MNARLTFLGLIVLARFLCAPDAAADDLGTTNQGQIQSFWQAVQASNGPVTVLAFGDSVSDDYLSIQKQFFWRLAEHFGSGGFAFSGGLYQEASAGVNFTGPDSNWWTVYAAVPASNHLTTLSLTCDRVGVFWIAQPNGGDFTISAWNSGSSNPVAIVGLGGYSATPVGCYTNVLVTRGYHNLRVDGVSGTNAILGVQLMDSTVNGISAGFMSQDGQNLGAILDVSTNILYPILSGLNPQLVVWHMKEIGDPGTELILSNNLVRLESLWQVTMTHGDIVYLGTPYDGNGSAERQNPVVRQAAVRDHRAYIDCMTPCISYQQMLISGLLRDSIHPNDLCNSFLANTVVWPQLDLARLETRQLITNSPLAANPIWLPSPSNSLPVYGWASSTPEEGTVVLRNLSKQKGSALLDFHAAFSMPDGSQAIYDVSSAYSYYSRSPLTSLYTGQSTLVTLNGSEVVAIEAHPRAAPNRLSMEMIQHNLILSWPTGQLEHADSVLGGWTSIPEATSPWLVAPTNPSHFYRIAPD